MAYLAQAPDLGGSDPSLVQRLLNFIRPRTAGDVGMSMFPMVGMAGQAEKAASTIIPRMLGRDVSQAASEASPNLTKWVMDKAGKVHFAPAGVYHEEMLGQIGGARNLRAGGVIDSGRVNLFHDLGGSWTEGMVNGIKQTVAEAWKGLRP